MVEECVEGIEKEGRGDEIDSLVDENEGDDGEVDVVVFVLGVSLED